MAYGPMSTPRRSAPRSMGTPTMPIRRVSAAAWRLFTSGVVIKTAAGFSAEVASSDHLPQQGRRGKARLLEFIEQDVGDVQRGIQSDVVEQGKWAHRVTGAEHHADVDVLSGR